jgi:hypothetical protein
MDPSPIHRITSGSALMELIGATSPSRHRRNTSRRVLMLMLITQAILSWRQTTQKAAG